MPPPASYVDITSDSFSYQVQVAEFNIANERWFRMVTGADPVMFGWYVGLATGFNPDVRLFESDGTTLIDGTDGALSYSRPLANNSTYYIQVRNNTGPFGPIIIAFNTLFEWIVVGYNTIPYGTFLINDDVPAEGSTGFPSAIYDADGTFIGYIGTIPAGEIGDALPDRTTLWHDRYGMYGGQLALFNPDTSFVDDFTPNPPLLTGENFFPNIVNDGTDFYIVDRGNTGNVFKLDVSGPTLSAPIATIAYTDIISAVGVTRDGSVMYWAEGEFSNVIRAWDLNTDSSLGAFYTIPGLGANFSVATTGVNDHPGELLVLLDGKIVTYVHDFTNDEDRVLYLNSDGTLSNAITFDTTLDDPGIIDHIFYSPLGPTYIRVWFFTDTGAAVGRYGDLNLESGEFAELFLVPLRNDGESLISGDDTIFSPSASCSMVTIGYGEGGTIIVTKTTIPSSDTTSFEITAGGGLTPASFELAHGESQSILEVTPGSGYSITETADTAEYAVSYQVSNGSPVDNITVASGETVTVAITNQTTTRIPIRRLRVTPTVTNENKRLFVPMIEIDAQVGVGNATGATEDTSPVLMVRQSTDGGYTWGNERTIGLGEIGKYNELLRLWRWNAGRRLVFEVSSSAAVPAVLTDLWITVESGDS
jgi:hypothetical protein